jgi:hypothetical protein
VKDDTSVGVEEEEHAELRAIASRGARSRFVMLAS